MCGWGLLLRSNINCKIYPSDKRGVMKYLYFCHTTNKTPIYV